MSNYNNSIDNPKGVQSIKNYMIGPLINLDDKTVGVVQLFNHKSGTILPHV
jgi:hypothetical protein